MNITSNMNSFDVLHLKENATDEEIKEALKLHVDMFCGKDGNTLNADGEYLLKIYHEHYKKLMDKEEKARMIEELRQRKNNPCDNSNKNALMILKTQEEKQNYMITSINKEIIERYSEERPKVKFSLKKVSLKNTYVIVGQDCSLIFADSVYRGHSDVERKDENGQMKKEEDATLYTLEDCFFKQNILNAGDACWPYFALPWDQGQVFKVNGILSIAFLASKIFPNSLIYNGKIKESDFRLAYDIIYNYLKQNSLYVASLFEDVDEEEVNKRMR